MHTSHSTFHERVLLSFQQPTVQTCEYPLLSVSPPLSMPFLHGMIWVVHKRDRTTVLHTLNEQQPFERTCHGASPQPSQSHAGLDAERFSCAGYTIIPTTYVSEIQHKSTIPTLPVQVFVFVSSGFMKRRLPKCLLARPARFCVRQTAFESVSSAAFMWFSLIFAGATRSAVGHHQSYQSYPNRVPD